ncbi:MAG TPA: hypothetical protein VFY84_12670 [Jiangellales bacterium]|nr:hypothetical protein [Jiangellales bacterium]
MTELVYEIHVNARHRYETNADGVTFSRFLHSLVAEELPPAEAVELLRSLADGLERVAQLGLTSTSPVPRTAPTGEENGS